jgi:hypothetical protein
MLIIDELRNLLAATAQRQRETLNLFRFLGTLITPTVRQSGCHGRSRT